MKPINLCLLTLMLMLSNAGCERELAKSSEPAQRVVITNVSVPATCVQGDSVGVVVTVENRGDQQETCEVILTDRTDGREIGRRSVTLSAAGTGGISESCALSITGEAENNRFGVTIVAGDVNGDGYNDLLVAAPGYNNWQGRAYLYYGGPDMDSKTDKIFTGEDIGDGFSKGGGPSIYLADMNNDGFDDVIVGAREVDNAKGRVYIFYGGLNMDGSPDIVIEGHETDSQFGHSIAVGDLNGDGQLDLVIGANRFGGYRGRAYLYYGPITSDSAVDKIFTGEAPDDTFAFVMTARGDVDGDGCDDLLIGTLFWPENTTHRGRAYFYYGATGSEMDNIADLIFTGENDGDNFGHGLGLFDIDNDGFADVLITARKWPGDGTVQGRTYLYWGSGRATMDNVADLTFTGEADAQATFGGNSVYAGYVNDDPYGDIIISAFGYYRYSDHGCAYLFYGGPKKSMDVVCDRIFFEEHVGPQAYFGKDAAVICDLNNDGFDDVVLGAYAYNNFQGRVSIYWNKPPSATELKFNWDTTNAFAVNHILEVKVNAAARKDALVSSVRPVTVSVKPAASSSQQESLEEPQKVPAKSTVLWESVTSGVKKPNTSFTAAAVDGDLEQMKLHLAWGAGVNEKTISGDTALHYAIKYKRREVAELLIANGADMHGRNRDGETPAHLAIKANQKEVLDLLLAKGATVSSAHLAAYRGDLAVARKAVSKTASVNTADEGGLTLLHAAASAGRKNVVEYLIGKGANLDARDKKKQTPLFCAAASGHREVVGLLLAKGAAPNPARAPDHWTPLYAAVDAGHRDVVGLLADNGGNVNARAITDDTPLHAATLKNDKDMAKLLIRKGAALNARNARYGNTPLHLAVVAGYRDIVELLSAKRPDLDIRNTDGFTPLHYAVSSRRLSWWESRIGKSSSPNDLEIAELLVTNGADVNAKSDNGVTPLVLARKGSKVEIADLLRKHEAKE